MAKPVCVVAGVGPGLGAALVRRFAAGGYALAAMARRSDSLKDAVGKVEDCLIVGCDVGDESQVKVAYDRVQAELGPVEVLLYNAGAGVWRGLDGLSAEDFSVQWRTNALGLFLAAKQVVPGMVARGRGVIGVTGATASLRGRPMTTGFAAGKAAQRSLAQSLARDLGLTRIIRHGRDFGAADVA